MNITMNGVTLNVGDAQVVDMMRFYLFRVEYQASIRLAAAPRIGDVWPGQGGIYAGMVRGDDGKPDYPIILVNGETRGPWDETMKWAQGLQPEGRKDCRLPTRREHAVLYANLADQFKGEWHWSCEAHASGPSCAWVQHFGNGGQGNGRKGYGCRARAVRQVLIIE